MSAALEDFKTKARARKFKEAFKVLNTLSMEEMLDGLASLDTALLEDLRAQRVFHAEGLDMPRMTFAMDTVKNRVLATPPPGLPKDQVDAAKKWLASHPPAPTKRKKLKITFFWSAKARGESITPALVQKAQEVLRGNGDQFLLDVLPSPAYLSFDKDVFESEACDNPDLKELNALAEKSSLYAADRLPIILYRSLEVLDAYGQVRDVLAHGCGCKSTVNNRAFVTINVRKVAADNVTLLHEIGHAAGNDHRFSDDTNFMSYGKTRTKVDKDQAVKFGNAYFCA